ncbi:glycosyltransferase [Clostridium perfringens]|uniref:glycosyltransferase n=1 Tax=Clostridium perfringens TaxID=1502 RepID=UPI002A2B01EE|nr:glycosyltransferase [Clostridium perfringens]MDK0756656.1 glycosyltransferase [Clostridium perfringens]
MDLSIIIPVYNSEEYLDDCLKSVINQTVNSKEVIIVNDGSTDSSKEIIKKYSDNYEFIKVITKKNQGVSIARNDALKIAKGEYIAFVDSDDIIYENMFDEMVTLAKKNCADIVECDYQRFRADEDVVYDYENCNSINVLYEKKALIEFLNFNIKGYLCTKIYKRKNIIENKIKFLNFNCFEDMMFNLEAFNNCNTYVKINKDFYKYRIVDTSLSCKINENHIKIYSIQMKIWNNYIDLFANNEIKDDINIFKIKTFVTLIIWFFNSKKEIFIVDNYKNLLKKNYTEFTLIDILKNNKLSKGFKGVYLLYKFKIYDLVYKYYLIKIKFNRK